MRQPIIEMFDYYQNFQFTHVFYLERILKKK